MMTDPAQVLPAATAIAAFACFALAVRSHFASATMPGLMQIVSLLALGALGAGLVGLFQTTPGPARAAIGVAGMGLAVWLFCAALAATRGKGLRLAFDPAAPPTLVTTGPYSRVRHPIYLAYFVFWLAWLVVAPTWIDILLVGFLLALYVLAARQEEAMLCASGQDRFYSAYRQQARFPWPRLSRCGGRAMMTPSAPLPLSLTCSDRLLDPNRLVLDPDASRANPDLHWVLLRVPMVAAAHFGATPVTATVRAERQAFDRRMLQVRHLAGPAAYPTLLTPLTLMTAEFRDHVAADVFHRNPFLRPEPGEGEAHFGPAPQHRTG